MGILEKVSVIMPVYNGGLFLDEAIQSVLAQTHSEFELIILDDGSTDGSLTILRRFEAGDPRIKVVARENKGLCYTLNELIDRANCDLVFMMHADDVMFPNRLCRQIEFLAANPDVDICSSFVKYINEFGDIIGSFSSDMTSCQDAKNLAEKNKLIGFNHPSTAFRRSVVMSIGGYRQPFWPCEDMDLWNRAVEIGAGICVIPEYLLKYRIHGRSASIARSTFLRLKHHYVKECMARRRRGRDEISWDEFISFWRERPPILKANTWRKDVAKAFYKKAVLAYAQGKYRSFIGWLGCAFTLQPIYVSKQAVRRGLNARRSSRGERWLTRLRYTI